VSIENEVCHMKILINLIFIGVVTVLGVINSAISVESPKAQLVQQIENILSDLPKVSTYYKMVKTYGRNEYDQINIYLKDDDEEIGWILVWVPSSPIFPKGIVDDRGKNFVWVLQASCCVNRLLENMSVPIVQEGNRTVMPVNKANIESLAWAHRNMSEFILKWESAAFDTLEEIKGFSTWINNFSNTVKLNDEINAEIVKFNRLILTNKFSKDLSWSALEITILLKRHDIF